MQSGLGRDQLNNDPMLQFETWFKQACEVDVVDANAMSLATVSAGGRPSIRTVLLKTFDQQGFVFFTNYTSQKAQEIAENSSVAALFPWTELERQVEVCGKAERISIAESLKYITSRPRGSQLGAWVSRQSSVIDSRQTLVKRMANLKERFANGAIPNPTFWGGYRIVPETIEFWQGREGRLHDRFEYTKANGEWCTQRLAP